jgi:hypothetical protein
MSNCDFVAGRSLIDLAASRLAHPALALERVDLARRCQQLTHRPALVASARLETDRRDREATQPRDQLGPTGPSLRTAKLCCSGSTMTSSRSFDTSIPQNESIAIFVPLPC